MIRPARWRIIGRIDALDEIEGALEIGIDHHIPIFLAHAHGKAVAGEPGVVDKNVHAAEIGDDLFRGRGDRLRIGDIHGVSFRGAGMGGVDFLRDFRGVRLGAAHTGDFCPFVGEADGDGLADSAACPGDDSDLVFEFAHSF